MDDIIELILELIFSGDPEKKGGCVLPIIGIILLALVIVGFWYFNTM